MSEPSPPGRQNRLYYILVNWFEEQVRSGALRAGDRLPPERKLGERFGISRTAVREALRALAARGLVESHVGRGTFVRLPAIEHITEKLDLLHRSPNGEPGEALLHVLASLAHLAALRRTEEKLAELHAHVETAENGFGPFLCCLGEAASNPLMGTLAQALVRLQPHQEDVLRQLDLRSLVSCIAAQQADAARQAVLAKAPLA